MKDKLFKVTFYNSDGSQNVTYQNVRGWTEKHAYIRAAYQQIEAARPIDVYEIEEIKE